MSGAELIVFKHGDRVKCSIMGAEIDDARISIDRNGRSFVCQNIVKGIEADNLLGYKKSWILPRDYRDSIAVENLRHAEKSFNSPEVGDEYKDKDGFSRFVLGVAGRVVFLSSNSDKDSVGASITKERLAESGFVVVQKEKDSETKEDKSTRENEGLSIVDRLQKALGNSTPEEVKILVEKLVLDIESSRNEKK